MSLFQRTGNPIKQVCRLWDGLAIIFLEIYTKTQTLNIFWLDFLCILCKGKRTGTLLLCYIYYVIQVRLSRVYISSLHGSTLKYDLKCLVLISRDRNCDITFLMFVCKLQTENVDWGSVISSFLPGSIEEFTLVGLLTDGLLKGFLLKTSRSMIDACHP